MWGKVLSIRTRTPTAEEQAIIRAQARPDIASYIILTIFLGLASIVVLGVLGQRLVGWFAPNATNSGLCAGGLVGAAWWQRLGRRWQQLRRQRT